MTWLFPFLKTVIQRGTASIITEIKRRGKSVENVREREGGREGGKREGGRGEGEREKEMNMKGITMNRVIPF